ncbi:uncharacterized protein LOC121977812 [Zingiber officinale]|uniref:Dof zinc finger protein n=1 Tax=Zingiber officinale TaxID=94328 RepID=A0A8J5GN32_ZINOF|nr:uncharacterized protein LOC121977812 [Zingiber officinale]KAG6511592.1 hypothetical protein ZIOFF_029665 [Zingiber officinale]
MTTPSVQFCMDSSDWLKSIVVGHENSSGSLEHPLTFGELISCTTPVVAAAIAERRLRPQQQQQQEQALKCPRCNSTHTKFCYYNNYSLSQPRYFCKTCRRYWTKGGSLRNVPVGGRCRKNKRSASSDAKKGATLLAPHQLPPALSLGEVQLQLPQYPTNDDNLNFMDPDKYHFDGLNLMEASKHGLGGDVNTLGLCMDGALMAEACHGLKLPLEDGCRGHEVKTGDSSWHNVLPVEWQEPIGFSDGLPLSSSRSWSRI